MDKVTITAELAKVTEHWTPRIIGQVNDQYVKVAKLLGEFVWHAHENEDELFYVLKGNLRIEFEGTTVELAEGDTYVVPKGVPHNPVAEEECLIMLIEKKSTLHTGEVITPMTRTIGEQLRPL